MDKFLNIHVIKPLLLLISSALVLVACAGIRYQSSDSDPYKVKPKPVRIKKYKDSSAIFEHQVTEQSSLQKQYSPAVLALLGDSESSIKTGRLNAAVATIERALRIEPRNASLVYKLAKVRMQQGKSRLAENLAKKADILASGDIALKRQIWLLIADAQQKQDNEPGNH